jgi:hypothetical protein
MAVWRLNTGVARSTRTCAPQNPGVIGEGGRLRGPRCRFRSQQRTSRDQAVAVREPRSRAGQMARWSTDGLDTVLATSGIQCWRKRVVTPAISRSSPKCNAMAVSNRRVSTHLGLSLVPTVLGPTGRKCAARGEELCLEKDMDNAAS